MSLTFRRAFVAVILVELLFTVFLCVGRYMPSSHDSFQQFAVHRFFLSQAANGGDVAQWAPQLAQGSRLDFWWAIHATPIQTLMTFAPRLIPGRDGLTAHYVATSYDAFVLLIGTWLLARRLFETAEAAALATLTVVGSTHWYAQSYWNFYPLLTVPIIVDLLLDFSRRPRALTGCAAGVLLVQQCFGGLTYVLPFASLIIALLVSGQWIASPSSRPDLRALARSPLSLAATAIVAALALSVAFLLSRSGMDEIYFPSRGRLSDHSVPIDVFLAWGGQTDLRTWADLALGTSPSLDRSVFVGYVPLLLFVGGLPHRRGWRARAPFVFVTAFVVLFALGGLVSKAVFHLWPGMKFFRHLALTASVARIPIALAAAGALDAALLGARGDAQPDERPDRLRLARTVVIHVAGAALVVGLAALWRSPALLPSLTARLVDDQIARAPIPHPSGEALRSLVAAALSWAVCAALLRARRDPARARVAAAAALLVSALDLYSFRWFQADKFMTRLTGPRRSLAALTPIAYDPQRRTIDNLNPREMIGGDLFATPLRGWRGRGVDYSLQNLFWEADQIGLRVKYDFWPAPLQDLGRLMRPALPNAIYTYTFPSPVFDVLPGAPPWIGRTLCATDRKVRFYRDAWWSPGVGDVAYGLLARTPDVDVLMLSPRVPNEAPPQGVLDAASAPAALQSSRALLRYRVRAFDANRFDIQLSSPAPSDLWMLYCDVDSRDWHATVDGAERRIYRANLAYKAVLVPRGGRVVRFAFQVPSLTRLQRATLALSIASIVAVLWWSLRRRAPPPTVAAP